MSAIEKIDNEMHNVRTGEISINEKAMSAWNELDFTIQSCHKKASYLIGFATALAKQRQSHQPAPEKINEQGGMKWVKASERMPKESDAYVCRIDKKGDGVRTSKVSYMEYRNGHEKFINYNDDGFEVIEWLDESTPNELEEEVRRLKAGIEILKDLCNLKSYKDEVGKDVTYLKTQPVLWERANDFLNSLNTNNHSE